MSIKVSSGSKRRKTPVAEVPAGDQACSGTADRKNEAPKVIEAAAWQPAVAPEEVQFQPQDVVMLEAAKTSLNTAAAPASTPDKAATDAFAAAKPTYEAFAGKAKEMIEQNMKSMTEMTEFAKGNVEAMVASAKAATTGAETIMAAVVEHGKKQYEGSTAALKSFTTVKTPAELFQLQNDFIKGQFDQTVAMWSNLSETMLKVAGEVTQPLSSRMALATEQMKAKLG